MKDVLAVLLAGGMGERLYPLTKHRAKPAVPFGGMYRIIDFSLSNCMNSGLRRIHVLVQYKSNSLVRHIRQAWNVMRPEYGEYVDIIPPQMRVNDSWYRGTADAIYQNLYSIDQEAPRRVLILSGDHIYKMDYDKMLEFHEQSGADLTMAAIEVPVSDGYRFGIVEVDKGNRVVGFEEKPAEPMPVPAKPTMAFASMGVYVFNTDVLKDVVLKDAERNSAHDFGKNIVPGMIRDYRVFAYNFQDENRKTAKYWRDVGTIDAYWESNMDLVAVDPLFNLYDKAWPIRTYMPQLPPAKFVFADTGQRFGVAVDSIVGSGSIVSGGMVRDSVLSPEVRVNSYSSVEECILMDRVNVGRHVRLRRAIVEKGVDIPEGAVIGYDLEEDAKYYRVTEKGVVVVESTDKHRQNPHLS
ncbi:MAG: glucose-1-phosphate adenylyltransferase [Candidatus Hydrogenedentota bacterium]